MCCLTFMVSSMKKPSSTNGSRTSVQELSRRILLNQRRFVNAFFPLPLREVLYDVLELPRTSRKPRSSKQRGRKPSRKSLRSVPSATQKQRPELPSSSTRSSQSPYGQRLP